MPTKVATPEEILKQYGLTPATLDPESLERAQLEISRAAYTFAEQERKDRIRVWETMRGWRF